MYLTSGKTPETLKIKSEFDILSKKKKCFQKHFLCNLFLYRNVQMKVFINECHLHSNNEFTFTL